MLPIVLVSFFWLLWAQTCAGAAIAVHTYRDGSALIVEASADIPVTPRRAWDVLTDYDRLSEFVPDLMESRVIERQGDQVVVEQKGKVSFLFFNLPVFVRMEIVERPPHEVLAKAVKGSFQEMTGRYALEPSTLGVKLSYTGRFVPNFGVPRFIGDAVLKHAVEEQFGAMVHEIERRDGVVGQRGNIDGASIMQAWSQ